MKDIKANAVGFATAGLNFVKYPFETGEYHNYEGEDNYEGEEDSYPNYAEEEEV